MRRDKVCKFFQQLFVRRLRRRRRRRVFGLLQGGQEIVDLLQARGKTGRMGSGMLLLLLLLLDDDLTGHVFQQVMGLLQNGSLVQQFVATAQTQQRTTGIA